MARWMVSVEPELAAGAQGPVTTAVTVALMTWVVMPRVTRLLHRWLYP
jgi:antibiotic biosynthesis monooxygenase (ABM) superfamily enzyme